MPHLRTSGRFRISPELLHGVHGRRHQSSPNRVRGCVHGPREPCRHPHHPFDGGRRWSHGAHRDLALGHGEHVRVCQDLQRTRHRRGVIQRLPHAHEDRVGQRRLGGSRRGQPRLRLRGRRREFGASMGNDNKTCRSRGPGEEPPRTEELTMPCRLTACRARKT